MTLEIEDKVKAVVADRIARKSSFLAQVNLRSGPLEVVIRGEGERRESEMRVYFMRNENIEDALEFHIFRNGTVQLNLDRIGDWVDACLDDICRRACSRI